MITWFLSVSSLVLLIALLFDKRKNRVSERLEEMAGHATRQTTLPESADVFGRRKSSTSVDRRMAGRKESDGSQSRLADQIVQAGLYNRRAVAIFWVVRAVLFMVPVFIGLLAGIWGMLIPSHGVLVGMLAGAIGTLAPKYWLDSVKKARQTKIRRALPDALDVMAVCLEGGLSLQASFSRVAQELATAHPMLALELNIVEREMRMGRTTGESVRQFADRFDLEELRSMASVITHAERFGSSVVKAITVFSDSLREKRQQLAEERAHKASVMLIFPTALFIFPGIFVVILGPAAIMVYRSVIESDVFGG